MRLISCSNDLVSMCSVGGTIDGLDADRADVDRADVDEVDVDGATADCVFWSLWSAMFFLTHER